MRLPRRPETTSFCAWLHGMHMSHQGERAIAIWSRYTSVYLDRKALKARGWIMEAHLKKEFADLMVRVETLEPVEFFNDFFDAREGGTNSNDTIQHRRICFLRKPRKKLNGYQVLRFIKEGK